MEEEFGIELLEEIEDDSVIASGTCGKVDAETGKDGTDVTWELTAGGTLTISGTGDMDDYYEEDYSVDAPWYRNKKNITKLVIEKGVTSIGTAAFYGCSNLESVEISSSVKNIGAFAFYNCNSLESVSIPEGVTVINRSAFYNCSNLKSISIPSSVIEIKNSVFSGCSNLESVSIPEGVTVIDKNTFFKCSKLKSIVIPSSVMKIRSDAFYGCSSLETVTIPSRVNSIGSDAFAACINLKELTISKGVTHLKSSAFEGCSSLKEIIIPDSIKVIDYNAFGACTGLQRITFQGDAPVMGTYVFSEVTANVYYPFITPGWTQAMKDGYDGNLTWIALGDAPSNDSSKDDSDDSNDDTPSDNTPVEDAGDVDSSDVPETGEIPQDIWVTTVGDATYTGSAIKPEVRVYNGTTLLFEGSDYTTSYKNNTNVNTSGSGSDAPQVVINLKGNYSGSEVVYFKIQPVNIGSGECASSDLVVKYTGKKQTPTPSLLWNGKKLSYGKDFDVAEYSNGGFSEAGTHQLTLTGKNNFTGTRKITLTISDNKNQIDMNKVIIKGITNQTWTGSQIKPIVSSVSYKKTSLKENSDYTISYGANTDVGVGTVTFTGTGKDSNKDGISYIGSKTITFKITGGSISKAKVSGIDKQYTFTGKLIKPTATLTYQANKTSTSNLREGKDYTVTYKKNKNKGTATIIFTGINGYTGTKKQTFKIVAGKITESTAVSFQDTANVKNGVYVASYVKGGVKPEVVVKDGSTTLVPGKDYTISYKNNKKVGLFSDKKAPSIIIKGKGNYSGSKTINFTIQ